MVSDAFRSLRGRHRAGAPPGAGNEAGVRPLQMRTGREPGSIVHPFSAAPYGLRSCSFSEPFSKARITRRNSSGTGTGTQRRGSTAT